jgi:hypothetical protein
LNDNFVDICFRQKFGTYVIQPGPSERTRARSFDMRSIAVEDTINHRDDAQDRDEPNWRSNLNKNRIVVDKRNFDCNLVLGPHIRFPRT